MALDLDHFDVLTFDCYGTLIDWETGLLGAMRPILAAHGVTADDEDLLERYARHEAGLEDGTYLPYREVLSRGLAGVAAELGATPTAEELASFGGSVADWPAFPDSADALARLKTRYRLVAITNCDDDLFAASNARLGSPFADVITAQQAQSYKPSHRNFEIALDRIGLDARVLHVAQSLFHDHVPAKALGLHSVWVNRRHDRPGSGATPPAAAEPDLTVPDMATLADLAGV
jgi:2-haloacid dehalogenase